MMLNMADYDWSWLDNQVRTATRTSLDHIWDDDYGLSDEDVGNTAHVAGQIYLDRTDNPAADCIDRALDIAFEERDKLYKERM